MQFDGDYWHAHPDKYSMLDHRQQKRVQLDKSQDAYMTKCGYTVLRFWESTIYEYPEQVQEIILKQLTLSV